MSACAHEMHCVVSHGVDSQPIRLNVAVLVGMPFTIQRMGVMVRIEERTCSQFGHYLREHRWVLATTSHPF